jgi:tetratricopeptide (TPR) repeat protein
MADETSEIAKLTERIFRDPKSRLFVPLAEEYKKAGDVEMAIHVLSEGLKNNPGYVTARSFLGRLLLEKGDLKASQREFEEVAAAVPDNLLARRKLGDLHILQGRKEEALEQYRIAVSLNPSDKEFISMVSDIEAGLDVLERLRSSKAALSPEPAPVSKAPAVASAADDTGVAKAHPPDLPEELQPEALEAPAETPSAMDMDEAPMEQAPPAVAPAEPPADMFSDEETPEEVLFVEPLDEEPAPSLPSVEAVGEEALLGMDFAEEAAAEVEAAIEEDAIVSMTPLGLSMEDAETATETHPEPFAEPVPAAQEQTAEVETSDADDFTTDTLAELYIAQGFYEKAIDIYQRMSAEKPLSRGLQEKLARVRAMAGIDGAAETAPQPLEEAGDDAASEMSAGVPDEVFHAVGEEAGSSTGLEGLFAEESGGRSELPMITEAFADEAPAEFVPPAAAEETTLETAPETTPETTPETAWETSDDVLPAPVANKTAFEDFEPREYLPSATLTRNVEEARAETEPLQAGTDAEARKETIDRLEKWLLSIKKEA